MTENREMKMQSEVKQRPMPRPGFTVEVISSHDALSGLEEDWNGLVGDSGIDHPFVRHEWIKTWWDCFGSGKALHVVVVRRGDRICAIAPLMIVHTRMYGLNVRQLCFIHNAHTPRCDFIVHRDDPGALGAIWNHISTAPDWDILLLQQLPAGSSTLAEIAMLAQAGGHTTGTWLAAESPFVRIDGSWEEYFKKLGRKHRSNIRNRMNRLHRIGSVHAKTTGSCNDKELCLELGLEIEASAWKREAGTAILCEHEVREFYARFAAVASDRGWLRLHFLEVAGRMIAFDYSLVYNGRLFVLKPGYDPEFSPYSPYNSLCFMTLQDAFRDGLVECDFLGTADGWKREWTPDLRRHFWLYIFREGVSSRLLHYLKFRLVPTLQRHRLYRVLRDGVMREGRKR